MSRSKFSAANGISTSGNLCENLKSAFGPYHVYVPIKMPSSSQLAPGFLQWSTTLELKISIIALHIIKAMSRTTAAVAVVPGGPIYIYDGWPSSLLQRINA